MSPVSCYVRVSGHTVGAKICFLHSELSSSKSSSPRFQRAHELSTSAPSPMTSVCSVRRVAQIYLLLLLSQMVFLVAQPALPLSSQARFHRTKSPLSHRAAALFPRTISCPGNQFTAAEGLLQECYAGISRRRHVHETAHTPSGAPWAATSLELYDMNHPCLLSSP